MTLRAIVHLVLHLTVPLALAWALFREQWQRASLVMLATMAVDLDHLFATPIYQPDRCSIGFHPLHGAVPIAFYALLTIPPRTRWVGAGLLVHMALDALDCALMR